MAAGESEKVGGRGSRLERRKQTTQSKYLNKSDQKCANVRRVEGERC